MSEKFLQNPSEAELVKLYNQILRYYENLLLKWQKSLEIQTKSQKFTMRTLSLQDVPANWQLKKLASLGTIFSITGLMVSVINLAFSALVCFSPNIRVATLSLGRKSH